MRIGSGANLVAITIGTAIAPFSDRDSVFRCFTSFEAPLIDRAKTLAAPFILNRHPDCVKR